MQKSAKAKSKYYFWLIALGLFLFFVLWPERQTLLHLQESELSFISPLISRFDFDREIATEPPTEIPILMYHYIRDPNKISLDDTVGRNLSVAPATLESHLKILQANDLATATLADLINGEIKNPSVVLTFDDGYGDFYTNALPILRKYKAKATVFVITGRLDQPGYLKSWQLQNLPKYDVEIGSHTINHYNLTNISETKLEAELEESKEDLESIIARPVVSFAYPSGRFNQSVTKQVEKSGYKGAVTTVSGKVNLLDSGLNYFALSRLRMTDKVNLVDFIGR